MKGVECFTTVMQQVNFLIKSENFQYFAVFVIVNLLARFATFGYITFITIVTATLIIGVTVQPRVSVILLVIHTLLLSV